MATCTTMTARDPFPRSATPRPTSTIRILTKQESYQSLNSPVLMSPTGGRPFPSVDLGSQDSPGWEQVNINVISPSTASHHSLYSDSDDDFRSPRLALLTSNLHGNHSHDDAEGLHTLISPSAPTQQPGDELLYDPKTEERPNESFFDPAFQAALAATKQELKDISLAIWGCPASHQLGSDLHVLKQKAQQLSEFEPSRTRSIGLVGDAGVGKSSVINSLLDQPCLARSSTSDCQPSSVITEYRYRPAHHNEPFGIEVDYMTIHEIKELFEDLLNDFRTCHVPAFLDVCDIEEQQKIRAKSAKAWHTLCSMFRNQPLFNKDFLLEYPVEADVSLIKVLEGWATAFLAGRPGGSECQTWCSTAFSVEDCADKLEAFTLDPIDDETPALWPFVRVVRVYLRTAILQSGLVLVDCPSSRNLNHSRAGAVERYIRSCHEVFAVTTMDRAVTDQAVVDIIKRNRCHRPLRIICTKSEDINVRDIERKQPEISLQVRTWRQQIETFQRQAKRAEAQRRHGIPGAMEEEVRTRDILQEMDFGLTKFLVERRNGQIATLLIDMYAGDVQMGDLKVFCVSNKQYAAHRYDEQSQAESRLELSGIVNLRKYCHSIPAQAQFEAATAFIEHDAPAFLGSLKQWAVGGLDPVNEEKAKQIRDVMKGLEAVAIKKLVLPSAQVHVTKSKLNHEFAALIVLPIREHRSEWRNAALEASKEWTKWSPGTYASFCRHHGSHTTPSTGPRNWSEELLSPMRQHLQSNFHFYEESIEDNKQELISSLHTVFDEISATLKDHLPDAPASLQNLLCTLQSRMESIKHIIDTSFADILEGTQHIECDALYGHTSSYISTLMAPAYTSAALLPSTSPSPNRNRPASPTLTDHTRKDIITTHIASFRIFPKLSTMIERSHRAFITATFDNMITNITKEVDALITDLHLVIPEEGGTSEAGRYEEFGERLRKRIAQAERVVGECRDVVRVVGALDEAER